MEINKESPLYTHNELFHRIDKENEKCDNNIEERTIIDDDTVIIPEQSVSITHHTLGLTD